MYIALQCSKGKLGKIANRTSTTIFDTDHTQDCFASNTQFRTNFCSALHDARLHLLLQF